MGQVDVGRLQLADAEVEELDEVRVTLLFDHEAVGWLHVAVDDARVMGQLEPAQDLYGEVNASGDARQAWVPVALEDGGQVDPFEVFHDQEGRAVRQLVYIEDLDHVLAVDAGSRDGFVDEPLDVTPLHGDLGGHELECHWRLAQQVRRLRDRTHAADAQQALATVLTVDDLAGSGIAVCGLGRDAHRGTLQG